MKKYKMHSDKVVEVESADGKVGVLLFDGLYSPFLRVYNPDNKEEFEDFYIRHSDMTVRICDDEAYLYRYKGNQMDAIDHSPQTLGLEEAEDETE